MVTQQDFSKTDFEIGSQVNGAPSIAADIKGFEKIYNPGTHDAHMALSEINLENRSN